jgi:hypothetical protein
MPSDSQPAPVQPPQPIPQEPLPPVTPMQTKKAMHPFVIVLLVILLLGIGGIGGYYLITKQTPFQIPKACTLEAKLCPDGFSVGRTGPNCEFTPCPTSSPTYQPQPSLSSDITQIDQTLSNIFSGNINFKENENNIKIYNASFTINNGTIVELNKDVNIVVYSNIKGKTQKEGYELIEWIRNFDKEINIYDSLTSGEHITEVYAGTGYVTAKVLVKNIGNRKYLVYDQPFSPSSTYSRIYLTYNSQEQNLIYIYVITYDFYAVKSTDNQTQDGKSYRVVESYPEDFQNFLNEVENVLAKY